MKQVIVVNQALRLPKGRLAAQVAHAAVSAYLEAGSPARSAWLAEGMPKIVLQAADDVELQRLYALAQAEHIPAALVEDAGRTVVPEGTITCLGLGPAADEAIDLLTGGLRLL